MADDELLTSDRTSADLDGTGFVHDDDALRGAFTTADFSSAVRVLDAVAIEADRMNHHPDVEVGWGRIAFTLSSHDAGGVTSRDVALARAIRLIADQQGARSA